MSLYAAKAPARTLSFVEELPEHEGDELDADEIDEGDEKKRRLLWELGWRRHSCAWMLPPRCWPGRRRRADGSGGRKGREEAGRARWREA